MTQLEFQVILYRALGEPVGLLLWAQDPKAARQRLYAARVKANDPALGVLQIRAAPEALSSGDQGGNLVIVKGQARAEDLI